MLFIFDMGGVVTTTFKMDNIYKELNITKDDFKQICGGQKDIWYDFQAGIIDTNTFWKEFNLRIKGLERFSGKDAPAAPVVKNDLFRMFFHPELMEETVKLIEKLKKNNRVVCGTNTIQSHWENHMERGDYSFFHQTYASNKIGEVKPDPAFFELIMKAEGYSPSETFFTDDKIENCEAAASLGINVVHFESSKDLYKKWKKYI